jgi:hypothetical protein
MRPEHREDTTHERRFVVLPLAARGGCAGDGLSERLVGVEELSRHSSRAGDGRDVHLVPGSAETVERCQDGLLLRR